MPKPKVTINGFELGMFPDITAQISNGFNHGGGIDIHRNAGILQVSQKLDAMTERAATNNITDAIMWQVKYSVTNKVFGLGSKRIYMYNGTTWGLVHIDANAAWGQGMAEFNGSLYYAGNTNLGKMSACVLNEDLDDSENAVDLVDSTGLDAAGSIIVGTEIITYTGNAANSLTGCTRGAYGSTAAVHTTGDAAYGFKDSYKTLTSDTTWHPMTIFGDYLVIGSGRYIEYLASDGTLTSTAVDLPLGYKIKCLAVYGNKLRIGTYRGSAFTDIAEAKLFSCTMGEMVGGEFEEDVVINECGINAMIVWRNNLVISAGIAGNFYSYNGASVSKICQVPKTDYYAANWGHVYPGAITIFQGNLLFGWISSSTEYAGLFMLDDNLVLTSPFILSTGSIVSINIYSLLCVGANAYSTFYAAYSDGSAYSVDSINTGRRITSAAFYESQIYEIENEGESVNVDGIEIIASPLQTGNSVKVEYKIDNASSWSDWATITSTNQVSPVWTAIGMAKRIQIRLEFTTSSSSNYSPEISTINIY
jgi:hypothetical protein